MKIRTRITVKTEQFTCLESAYCTILVTRRFPEMFAVSSRLIKDKVQSSESKVKNLTQNHFNV